MNLDIVVLPGDGVGPEVTAEAVRVLEAIGDKYGHAFRFTSYHFGGAAIDARGVPLPEDTLQACKDSAAVLLGAVGGPKWDNVAPEIRAEAGLLGVRKQLGLFANLRPVLPYPALLKASPLKEDRLLGVDLLVVRELTGGLYFGQPRFTREEAGGVVRAVDTLEYTTPEIERVVVLACELALGRRRKVMSIDKANVLDTSRLWRKTAIEVGERYEDVELDHMLVDAAAMRLITHPSSFDVIVTGNMFGDILTDEASVLTGSLGALPSASLGDSGPGLFEPIHGSAPDIAGQGVANPMAAILSAAMLLRHSFKFEDEAQAIESAVHAAIDAGVLTRDLGGSAGTREVGDHVVKGIL